MPPLETRPPFDPKVLVDAAVQFFVVFKLAKVYEPNNANFRARLGELYSVYERLRRTAGEMGLQYRPGFLFVNWTRIKFDASTHAIFRSLAGEFLSRRLGAVVFRPDLSSEELGRFMLFLARSEVAKDEPFEALERRFQAAGFAHVRMEKLPDLETDETSDGSPAPIYFLGVFHLQQLFGNRTGAWNFYITKRWIESICDLIALDESFLFGLVNIKNFEDYTLNHSVNVSILSLALGRRIGLSRSELVDLGISAALHDVGKQDVPKEILEKPAALDAAERSVIERHSHEGASTLIRLMATHDLPLPAVQVALEHHVMANLGGYPKYVRRKRVTLFSRIVKITDYYDAVTTPRVYRPNVLNPEATIRLMAEKSGTEFDPVLLRVFARMLGPYPVGSLVALNGGEIGIVFENHPQAALSRRPVVKIIADSAGRRIDGPVVDLSDPGAETRLIVKSLDPARYGVQISDYFLARAGAALGRD